MKSLVAITLLVGCGSEDPVQRCADPALLADLDTYVSALGASASLVATHPGPTEAVGFYAFPRLELAHPADFAGLFMFPCTDGEPNLFAQACGEDGVCTQLECTGVGSGWIFHYANETAVGTDPVYSTATIDTSWVDGATGITFQIAAETESGTDDWSFTATGRMDVDTMNVVMMFPFLTGDGTLAVTASIAADGTHAGTVAIENQPVATADPETGVFLPNEGCE